jgi:transposase
MSNQTVNELVLAIDFSLDSLDVGVWDDQGQPHWSHRSYENNSTGCQALCVDLSQALAETGASHLTVTGEATGAYWWHTYRHLDQAPELAAYDPTLQLFNAKHVKYFRNALPERDKTDRDDPKLINRYYRANPDHQPYQFQSRYDVLRALTRAYSRLIHTLAAQKAACAATIYLLASEYQRACPFKDLFGVTAQKVLDAYPDLSLLAETPVDKLAQQLVDLSGNKLPDPQDNAAKLQAAAQHSYPLPDDLRRTLQTIRQLSLGHIRFLETQQKTYQQLIEEELARLPEAELALAEHGLGPILVAGCLAEIGHTRRFTTGTKFDRKRKCHRPRRYRDGQAAVAKMAGLWWPQKQSGRWQGENRHLARERNPYLRFWLVQAAYTLQRHRTDYASYYWHKYNTTDRNPHQRALILTARKATRLIFALLHKGQCAGLKEGDDT